MKGELSHILSVFIKVVLLLLVIVAIWSSIKGFGTYAVESLAVSSSAEDLAAAINYVHHCIETNGVDATCYKEVKISIPQEVYGDASVRKDPLWVIFHNVDLKKKSVPVSCECTSPWDSGVTAPDCPDALCWGLIENSAPGRAHVEPEALKRLKSFWIIDPCYAVVRVYSDHKGGIDICFVKELEGPGTENFCYAPKSCTCIPISTQPIPLSDSCWPEDGIIKHEGNPNWKWCQE